MGCDIHCVLEVRLSDGKGHFKWVCADPMRYDPYFDDRYGFQLIVETNAPDDRDYDYFAALAGVRGDIEPVIEPRGIPKDACQEYLDMVERFDCDGHTHSWLTFNEMLNGGVFDEVNYIYEEIDEAYREILDNFWFAGIPKTEYRNDYKFYEDAMKRHLDAFSKHLDDVRMCFFFDN